MGDPHRDPFVVRRLTMPPILPSSNQTLCARFSLLECRVERAVDVRRAESRARRASRSRVASRFVGASQNQQVACQQLDRTDHLRHTDDRGQARSARQRVSQ
jgi:hypothetical protein